MRNIFVLALALPVLLPTLVLGQTPSTLELKSRVLARIIQKDNPRIPGPGIIEVFQQKDPDHYEKIESFQSGFAAQTGLFVPEWNKLFVATRHQAGGAVGEILVYETR